MASNSAIDIRMMNRDSSMQYIHLANKLGMGKGGTHNQTPEKGYEGSLPLIRRKNTIYPSQPKLL